ncbi:unnamed protein product [Callosobruchus maculatus]|uniref:Uncharacterized protein n=1 Tax=Callosobruchus maculatus TaxID=64391 RepID=A0A653CP11_CALMS|nr:unnamed protein product [Callosobruchus maculatus]
MGGVFFCPGVRKQTLSPRRSFSISSDHGVGTILIMLGQLPQEHEFRDELVAGERRLGGRHLSGARKVPESTQDGVECVQPLFQRTF